MAVIRQDRKSGQQGRVIGVVHPEFKPLQNQDAGMLFDKLFGKGKRVYHTGGYLKNGEIIWLLAKLPYGFKVSPKDKVQTYLLLTNSHDGSLPIDIRLTTVRVVCNNTLSLALFTKKAGHVFRHAHNRRLEVVEAAAEEFFRSVLEAQRATAASMTALDRAHCDVNAFKTFLSQLLPLPASPELTTASLAVRRAHETKVERIKQSRTQIIDIHVNGLELQDGTDIKIEPAHPTWWGALNSVTAWVDHASEITGDRYAHKLFGAGDRLKSLAFSRARLELPQ